MVCKGIPSLQKCHAPMLLGREVKGKPKKKNNNNNKKTTHKNQQNKTGVETKLESVHE